MARFRLSAHSKLTAWFAKSVLGSLRGHRHSKALTVPYSAANRTETSPEASSAPLPARDVAYEGSRVYSAITKLDPSAPYFVQSRTLDRHSERASSLLWRVRSLRHRW